MAKGRKPIIPDLKDKDVYKKTGEIENQLSTQPKGYPNTLPCPKKLTTGAQKEWRRIVKLLKMGSVEYINNLDAQALRIYCIEADIYNRLYEKWQDEGCKIYVPKSPASINKKKSSNGTLLEQSEKQSAEEIINPVFDAMNKHANLMKSYAEQLGLTPVGRASWTVKTVNKEKSAAEDFMGDE